MIKYPKCLFDKYGIDKIAEQLLKLYPSETQIIVDDQVGNVVIWSLIDKKPVTK